IGYILESMRRPVEAKTWYRKAIELDSKFADAHVNLGNILLGEGDAAGAVREFSAAAQASARSFAAHYNLALALEALGSKDESAKQMAIARQLATPQQLADF